MDIRCQKCGQLVARKTSNHRYKESGLDNLYLKDITVFECSCGASSPSIFRVPHLHNLIAEALLKKPALLSGREIRFLRKTLYMPANAFARTIGVGKTTLSKWENGLQQQSEAFDRLIRTTYLIAKGLKKRDQINTLKFLKEIKLRKSGGKYVIVAERTGDDYSVNLEPIIERQTEGVPSVKVGFAYSWTSTTHGFIIGTEREAEIVHADIMTTETRRSFLLQEPI
jgi:putative zinc finger/helix-turn-helix YgiT family protein